MPYTGGQEAKAPAELLMPWPFIFINTTEVLVKEDPPWQPSPATVDNQCGFGSVNIIEMFQGCGVPLSQPVSQPG